MLVLHEGIEGEARCGALPRPPEGSMCKRRVLKPTWSDPSTADPGERRELEDIDKISEGDEVPRHVESPQIVYNDKIAAFQAKVTPNLSVEQTLALWHRIGADFDER